MVLLCKGCHRSFSHSGYTYHGQRSKDQRCKGAFLEAIAEQLLGNVEGLDNLLLVDAHRSPSPNSSGHLQANDHPCLDPLFDDSEDGQSNNELDASDSDSDSDGSNGQSEQEEEWITPNLPIAEPQDPDHTTEHGLIHDPPIQDIARDHDALQHTIHIEHFTQGRAGATIDYRDLSTNQCYEAPFYDAENVYTPINSQIDWDFA